METLDYVFYSPEDFIVTKVEATETVESALKGGVYPNKTQASDHMPIGATLAFSA